MAGFGCPPRIHVDQDIQDVPGSPDLARTILDKIDASEVVVADVTLVGKVTLNADDDKKLINSNVAIELGYALRARGDGNVLLVFNQHYGTHQDLPFDLRHKGGAIVFNLPPDAEPNRIKEERKKLAARFVKGLKPYTLKVAAPPSNTSAVQRQVLWAKLIGLTESEKSALSQVIIHGGITDAQLEEMFRGKGLPIEPNLLTRVATKTSYVIRRDQTHGVWTVERMSDVLDDFFALPGNNPMLPHPGGNLVIDWISDAAPYRHEFNADGARNVLFRVQVVNHTEKFMERVEVMLQPLIPPALPCLPAYLLLMNDQTRSLDHFSLLPKQGRFVDVVQQNHSQPDCIWFWHIVHDQGRVVCGRPSQRFTIKAHANNGSAASQEFQITREGLAWTMKTVH